MSIQKKPREQKIPAPEERCKGSVTHRDDRWGHVYQCENKGAIEEDGKLWCKIHAPSSEKARKDKRHQKWKEESDARDAVYKEEARIRKEKEYWLMVGPDLLAACITFRDHFLKGCISAVGEPYQAPGYNGELYWSPAGLMVPTEIYAVVKEAIEKAEKRE